MGSPRSHRTSLFLVVALALAGRTAAAAPDRFVVLPFRNVPGYAMLDHLIAGAPAVLAEKLELLAAVRPGYGPRLLLEDATVPADAAAAARAATAAGARFVLYGSARRLANWDIELELHLLETQAGGFREVFQARGAGPRQEQLAVLDRLLTAALEAAGTGPEDAVTRQRLHRPPTGDPYAFYLYGRALGLYHGLLPGRKPDLEKAEALLRRVRLIDPGFVEARRFLALVLAERGDTRAARAEYTAVIERRPSCFWALGALARLYRAEGNQARALDFAARAVRARPWDADGRFLLGELLWQERRLDDAHRELRRVTIDAPRHAGARRLLAQVCAAQGRYAEQARELESLLELAPAEPGARMDLGAVYQRLQRWDDAIRVYEERCRRAPEDFMAHKLLGDLYRRKGDYRRAAAVYEQAQRLAPQDPRPYFLLSVCLAETGDLDRAEQVLEEAQQFKDYLGEAYNNLGAVCLERGDPVRAQAYLRRALIRLPDRPRVRYNLGLALAGTGQYDQALEEFQQAVRLAPTEAEYYFAAGVTLLKLGRVGEAETKFREAVLIGPDHPGARRNLALIAEMRRRRAEGEVVDPRLRDEATLARNAAPGGRAAVGAAPPRRGAPASAPASEPAAKAAASAKATRPRPQPTP